MENTYWYCGIQVKGVSTVYSYISDAGVLAVGSYVEVPFGKENHLMVGVVVACEEYAEENVPFPIEKTKHIIRTVSEKEYEVREAVPAFDDETCWETIEEELAEVDDYIEEEAWDEVLWWAIERQYSSDEIIIKKVIECYELCLKQKNAVAALNLGTFYYNGRFVPQDYKRAFALYKMAADAGEVRAICNCGYCFYYGRHQEVDYAEAFRYFSLGAILYNDANCLYKLGDMYLYGYGVDKNEMYAYILYERAQMCCQKNEIEEECLADVQLRLGKCSLLGIGCVQNADRALEQATAALPMFYKRRHYDKFAAEGIRKVKELIAQAQIQLDKEVKELW